MLEDQLCLFVQQRRSQGFIEEGALEYIVMKVL